MMPDFSKVSKTAKPLKLVGDKNQISSHDITCSILQEKKRVVDFLGMFQMSRV